MINNNSHIAIIRAQWAYNLKQIQWLTGMSAEMLAQFQIAVGLEWLKRYASSDDAECRYLISQPIVWRWWILEWNRRDEDWLHYVYAAYMRGEDAKKIMDQGEVMVAGETGNSYAKDAYQRLHKKVQLKTELPCSILEGSYAKMIGDFNKQITKNRN